MSAIMETAPIPIRTLIYDEYNLMPEVLNLARNQFVIVYEYHDDSLIIIISGRVNLDHEGKE